VANFAEQLLQHQQHSTKQKISQIGENSRPSRAVEASWGHVFPFSRIIISRGSGRHGSGKVAPRACAGPRNGEISRFRIRPVTAAAGHGGGRTGISPGPRRDATLAFRGQAASPPPTWRRCCWAGDLFAPHDGPAGGGLSRAPTATARFSRKQETYRGRARTRRREAKGVRAGSRGSRERDGWLGIPWAGPRAPAVPEWMIADGPTATLLSALRSRTRRRCLRTVPPTATCNSSSVLLLPREKRRAEYFPHELQRFALRYPKLPTMVVSSKMASSSSASALAAQEPVHERPVHYLLGRGWAVGRAIWHCGTMTRTKSTRPRLGVDVDGPATDSAVSSSVVLGQ
jgi:hypothetical protein